MALGMSWWDANSLGYRGTDQGTQMKTAYGWRNGDNGTNSSGFSSLPGGYRNFDYGYFGSAGYFAGFWSSSPYDFGAWRRGLGDNNVGVARIYESPRNGLSVRCIQDVD